MLHINANRLISLSFSPSLHQFHHIPFYKLKYHLFKWFTDDGLVGYGCKFPYFFFFLNGWGAVVYFLFSNKTANNTYHFQCTVLVYLQEKFPDSQTGIATSKDR